MHMKNAITNLPRCCGREMKIRFDLRRFFEAYCDVCRDVVYIKKPGAQKPQLLDD